MKWSELSPRERDALVAEKVFGHKVVKTVWGKQKQYGCLSIGEPDWWDDRGASELANPVPAYTTQIAAAWEVVERIATDYNKQSGYTGMGFRLDYCNESSNEKYRVTISDTVCSPPFEEMGDLVSVEADTAPEAICMAALKACGVEIS